MTKLDNSKFDQTQKLKLGQNSVVTELTVVTVVAEVTVVTEVTNNLLIFFVLKVVTKLKNSNCDKTQIVTRLKNANCDTIQVSLKVQIILGKFR